MNGPDRLRHLTDSPASLVATIRLLALGALGVRRCRWLLASDEPGRVVDRLLAGRLPADVEADETQRITSAHLQRWRDALREQDVDAIAEANLGGHHRILDAGHADWPFAGDPDPPVLVFVAGDTELLAQQPRVAVVGTRSCTSVGRLASHQLGGSLSRAGVAVVSGLAIGIDAAAHAGATGPGPRLAVVASGLDVVYPAGNAELWWAIQRTGVMLSETPMGQRATRWRFPARNRLIAGLADLVVVVESHARGGALITVDEAAARGVDVAAVPGSVSSPASEGTNQLLVDGVPPVRNGDDVCMWLGVDPAAGPSPTPGPPRAASADCLGGAGADPTPAILAAIDGGEVHVDLLASHLDLDAAAVLGAARRLARLGRLRVDGAVIGPIAGTRR